MEVSGKIRIVNPEVQVSATFKKRELVVSTEEQYPQHISVNFVQDKCDLLNNYNVGEAVKVSINLRGREWVSPQGETKYFNDIQGWKIERMAAEAPASSTQAPPMPAAEAFAPATNFKEEEHDDLPF
jgi:translation initiation factor IF-3